MLKLDFIPDNWEVVENPTLTMWKRGHFFKTHPDQERVLLIGSYITVIDANGRRRLIRKKESVFSDFDNTALKEVDNRKKLNKEGSVEERMRSYMEIYGE